MLTQLAHTIEQLDLAAEHIALGDANNARFALMLSDNVVELTLHRYAKEQGSELKAFPWRQEKFQHEKALEKALGRYFDEKVKFAKLMGRLSEEMSESIRIGHLFRNDVYHIGLQHEAVLPAVARFYFDLTCQFCADYEIRSWGYSPGQPIPKRTKKYLKDHRHFANFPKEYAAACLSLKAKSGHDNKAFVQTIADHMDAVIEEQDEYIDYIGQNAPNRESRDEVVIGCQTWPLGFSEEGKRFAAKNGFPGGHPFKLVKWLEENYPLKFRGDPIPAWRKRSQSVHAETDPHKALKKYRSFMDDTAELRESINESTSAVDQYIDGQIEQARLERAFPKERE
jgi:hypothetical protein